MQKFMTSQGRLSGLEKTFFLQPYFAGRTLLFCHCGVRIFVKGSLVRRGDHFRVGQTLVLYQSYFNVSLHCVCFTLLGMNSLLLANLTKNAEEARKPVSLHSGVAKDILLCNFNCVWFLQP